MKHFKHFALTVLLALVSNIYAFAYDFEVDGIYYNVLSLQDLTCEVTKGSYYYSGDVIIPSSVTYSGKTFMVTSIGASAFRDCSGLTSVTIGNSVTSIGNNAFFACNSLTSVTIGNSVNSIGNNAFYGCSGLTSVYISEIASWCGINFSGYTSNPLNFAHNLYLDNELVSHLVIPNSVTSILNSAFRGCTCLTSVTIGNSVTSIGVCAFYQCSGLTSVTIGNSVSSIGESAFSQCSGLTSINIPNSVTFIGNYAFENCSGLKEITSLNIIPPSIYDNTFNQVSKTECVVKVPEEAISSYQSAKYWESFWNIVGLNGGTVDEPETKKCAEPEIALVSGKIVAVSETENSTCYTSITSEDFKGVDTNNPISLSGVYTISSFAHAEGYENSETVTALLVWVNPTLQGSSNVLAMEAKKAVLIRSNDGKIVINGTERGERVSVYSIDGRELLSTTAADGETTLNCSEMKGAVVIVKYGGKSVKIVM